MIIYIDVLLFVNMCVTYFLLKAVCALTRQRLGVWRALLGSALGGAAALTIFWQADCFVLSLLVKLLMSAVIVGGAFSFKKLRLLIKNTALFFGVSFAFCGIMLAAAYALPSSALVVNNLSVYLNLSPVVLIIASCGCYIIIRLIARIAERRTALCDIYRLDIRYKNRRITINALLDSGCSLRDLYNGNPVIILSPAAARRLISERSLAGFMGGKIDDNRPRLIPYSAIGGEGLMPAYRADSAVISQNGESAECGDVTLAVGRNDFNSEYDALISRELAQLLG